MTALTTAGLLDREEASQARVEDLSRAHPVWRVSIADGRRLVVKAPAAERGYDLGIELLVYRMARWCEPLREALPTAVLVDEDLQVLVLEAVDSGSLAVRLGFPTQIGGAVVAAEPGWVAETLAGLGRTLGAVHRGTAGLPLPPARPPVALAGFAGEPLPGRLGELCAPLRDNPVVADAARSLARPVSGCLVSHDMKWDNVVPRPGGVVLLDWELAGSGDPALDLGFLLAEHLVRDGLGPLSPSARTLLSSYAEAAHLRVDVIGVLAGRVATAAGLRIAQLSIEVAEPGHAEPAATTLADLAIDALHASPDLSREVISCLT